MTDTDPTVFERAYVVLAEGMVYHREKADEREP